MHWTTILTDSNKRLTVLICVAAAALLLLIYTLSGGDEPPVAVSAASAPASMPASGSSSAPVAAMMPNAPPPSAAAAPPAPVAAPPFTVSPPAAPAAPAAPADAGAAAGLRLHGVTSGGAIIGTADGRQRLVRIGQQVMPGMVLQGVGQQHAMLGTPSGPVRLTFQGVEAAGAASAPQSAVVPSPAERQMRGARIEERRYAGAMQARTGTNGAVTGYYVRRGADLPLLRQAGLREGDVLISVNGQNIDGPERLTQLPAELRTAQTAEVEFERSGRRMRTTVQLNRR